MYHALPASLEVTNYLNIQRRETNHRRSITRIYLRNIAVTQVAWVNMFVDEQEALLELDASWEGTLLL